MKIISFNDIVQLQISPDTCYKWISEMLERKDESILPPKTHIALKDNVFCNIMPSVIFEQNNIFGGVKVVNRYPDRIPSLQSNLLLLDMKTGEFLALMDADWITAMRTGAVAAHSIHLFAKKDFSTVAFMGLGNTARATLLVLESLYQDKRFTIKLLRHKGQEVLFVDRFKDRDNLQFTFVDEYEDLIQGSDVIVSAVTYLENDICPDALFEEGVLVVPIHTRGFTNCDLFFDKIYADDKAHVSHFKNFDKFRQFAEVSDVVNGKKPGRESQNERILAYNIGVSIHDIFFASKIYQLLQEADGGNYINLCKPENKFWI